LTLFETGTYTRLMSSRRLLPAVFTLVAAALAGSAHLGAQAIQRALYVSVLDEAGNPIRALQPTDVVVREDNVAREVLRVAPADEPMQIAVLIDTSTASRDNISHFRTALPPFITALTNPNAAGAKNQVAIVAFGERPTIVAEYTSNVAELQKGINRLWSLPATGAYLLDAILEVTQGLKKREARRPVIIAITQEGTELSYRQYDQVLGPLRDSGAAFYALMIGTPSGALNDEARSRNIVVDEGTRTTGGYREQLLTPMALAAKLKTLADQLTHQYLVTYAHPQSLIPPEKVTVTAAKPGVTARGTLVKDAVGQGRQ
jgi:VWA domain-containing protein